MALVEIDVTVARVGAPPSRLWHAVDAADVTVQNADGTPRTVYTDETGATVATQPLKSDNGRVDGWVEGGILLRYRAVKKGELAEPEPWQYFVSGGGPIGPKGDPGAPGEVWFTGAGAPAGALGAVGDLYLASDTGDFYEKTGASAWTLRGNLKGPQGAAGEVTHAMMARGAFHVYRNAAWSIPHAAFTAIPFDTKLFDVSNAYDVANARFVAPVAGIYRFTAGMQLDQSTAAGVQMVLDLSPRHVQLDRRYAGATAVAHGVWGSGLAQLAAGAILQVNGYHEAGAARNVQVGQAYTFFQGELVAAT